MTKDNDELMPQNIKRIKWFQRQRLQWIYERHGVFNRKDIMNAFDISVAQASNDIKKFGELYPCRLGYNTKIKEYVNTKPYTPTQPSEACVQKNANYDTQDGLCPVECTQKKTSADIERKSDNLYTSEKHVKKSADTPDGLDRFIDDLNNAIVIEPHGLQLNMGKCIELYDLMQSIRADLSPPNDTAEKDRVMKEMFNCIKSVEKRLPLSQERSDCISCIKQYEKLGGE